jgi:TubC N-terminal docking domain
VTQATEILSELQRRGVIVAVEGDTLSLKPKRALDDTLLARVREAKPAILEALRNRPSTCSPDCYELEPGIWIHRPWAGCTTSKTESFEPRKVSVTCWHCRGEKSCACVACWKAGPGECVACEGSGHVWRWVQ